MECLFEKISRYFDQSFELGVLETGRALWCVTPSSDVVPYLKAQNVNGRHILMRPSEKNEGRYVMIDDLDWETIKNHHQYSDGSWKEGRMVIETSPENFQVWIHSDRSLSLDEKRFWLFKKLKCDPGSDPNKRWGRCPGFTNQKEKHRDKDGKYPWARLIWVDFQKPAHIPKITLPEKKPAGSVSNIFPLWNMSGLKEISRSDYDKGDESRTDFSYTLALIVRGCGDDEIRKRILMERQNWKNKPTDHVREKYIHRTIERARALSQQSAA